MRPLHAASRLHRVHALRNQGVVSGQAVQLVRVRPGRSAVSQDRIVLEAHAQRVGAVANGELIPVLAKLLECAEVGLGRGAHKHVLDRPALEDPASVGQVRSVEQPGRGQVGVILRGPILDRDAGVALRLGKPLLERGREG